MSDLHIAKYHGTGNDFVMIEDLGDEDPLEATLVAALCDRHRGVGADGVIRVTASNEADFFMDYSNADGSVAEMCGNGIRCVGKLVYERGLTEKTELEVMTRGGRKHLALHLEGGTVRGVTVGMGRPAFERSAIPMTGPGQERFLGQPFDAAGRVWTASAVSMGNPHVVLFTDRDPATLDVRAFGPAIERDGRFPQGTNVEFVTRAGGELLTRVWERGVGETMACGTGACAVMIAAHEAGLVGSRADVRFPGGVLDVEWEDGGEVLLTGPAERVFEATVDAAQLAAKGAGA